MKTAQEVREAKSRMINQGKLIAELKQHKGYTLLESRLKDLYSEARESVLASESFEDFRYRRGYLEGLNSLFREIGTITSRGKKQEALLKIK